MTDRYSIELARPAAREFRRLDPGIRKRILPKLRELAENPRPVDSVKLAGEENLYQIRVGDWRIIYEIREQVLIVLVLRIGHRRDVYRS